MYKNCCPVITFDPGTRNLGICRVDSYNNGDLEEHGDDLFNPVFNPSKIKIVYWNTIDLLEGTPDKDKIEKQVSITDLVKYLTEKLDKILPELLSGDTPIYLIEIEKQFATTRMCNISMAIYSYFVALKNNGSKYAPILNVQFQAPNHKYKLFYLLPGITKENIVQNNKSSVLHLKNLLKNKTLAVEKMKELMKLYDPYGDEITLTDMNEIISPSKKDKKKNYKNWSGQSHQDLDDSYRKSFAYDFNKKISVEMTFLFLYYFDIDPLIIEWFKRLSKKDDAAEAFNINIYVHIREKKIVNARTQYITRTVKKARRPRKRSGDKIEDKNIIPPKIKKFNIMDSINDIEFPENIDDLFLDNYSVIENKPLS